MIDRIKIAIHRQNRHQLNITKIGTDKIDIDKIDIDIDKNDIDKVISLENKFADEMLNNDEYYAPTNISQEQLNEKLFSLKFSILKVSLSSNLVFLYSKLSNLSIKI